MALLLPSAIKFSHAFNHHEHTVCFGEDEIHFHEVDIDCEFYKFKLTTESNEITSIEVNLINEYLQIEIVAKEKKLQSTSVTHFQLRAPPMDS